MERENPSCPLQVTWTMIQSKESIGGAHEPRPCQRLETRMEEGILHYLLSNHRVDPSQQYLHELYAWR
jgi:hypothetical protein